nr:MAG TPA: hypothetical protein [Caudoviricetes sp.]
MFSFSNFSRFIPYIAFILGAWIYIFDFIMLQNFSIFTQIPQH